MKRDVPRLSLFNKSSENSTYTNHSENNRNCYLCVTTFHSENILYSRKVYYSQDCLDCYWIKQCSNCYELWRAENCYECAFGVELRDCAQCFFSSDLVGCRNCMLCHGLAHKEFYIRNQPATKEEYEAERARLASFHGLEALRSEWELVLTNRRVKHLCLIDAHDCVGDYLVNCSNCVESYYLTNVQNCCHAYEGFNAKDIYDAFGFGVDFTECCYQVMSIVGCNNVCFSVMCYDCSDPTIPISVSTHAISSAVWD